LRVCAGVKIAVEKTAVRPVDDVSLQEEAVLLPYIESEVSDTKSGIAF